MSKTLRSSDFNLVLCNLEFMKKMTRICFVRHGETDWNVELRLQGQLDLALNASGQVQATAVGRRLTGLTAAAMYSSDLLRARQTAQPISEALQLPVILLSALRERHFGRCEGMTIEEIALHYEEDARAIERHDPDYASPGGGESRRQHQVRVLDCINHLVNEHEGQTIVVVTHGGVLDVIYRRARDLPLETPRDYPIPNAGINWLVIKSDQWVIENWGDATHLG